MNPSRRLFIQFAALTPLFFSVKSLWAAFEQQAERHLSFFHLHTEESLNVCYWRDNQYIDSALEDINYLLRDHRTGEQYQIDTALLDQLAQLHHIVDSSSPFHIISGFRSPKTNEQLRAKSDGVAQMSLHMLGQAIDIRLPDVPLQKLYDTARALEAGGVGVYPSSNFIHLDTGRVRFWHG